MAKIAILMGSASDYEVVKNCEDMLDYFAVAYETKVLSAHRTPLEACEFALRADDDGFDVIIAAAGKAAHLAGVIAANTPLPVIGIPIKTSLAGGLDSLFSIVQMPKGVPVATVAVDGAENAAILAVQMLSLRDARLREAVREYKEKIHDEVLESDRNLLGG